MVGDLFGAVAGNVRHRDPCRLGDIYVEGVEAHTVRQEADTSVQGSNELGREPLRNNKDVGYGSSERASPSDAGTTSSTSRSPSTSRSIS